MEAGAISFDRDPQPGDVIVDGIIFGDDSSEWSNDGECDDMRFEGPGMTLTPLLQEDMRTDATDCATAWENGQLWLWGTGD